MAGSSLVTRSAHSGPGMRGGDAIEQLAGYAVGTDFSALPAGPIFHAKRILLDTLGTII